MWVVGVGRCGCVIVRVVVMVVKTKIKKRAGDPMDPKMMYLEFCSLIMYCNKINGCIFSSREQMELKKNIIFYFLCNVTTSDANITVVIYMLLYTTAKKLKNMGRAVALLSLLDDVVVVVVAMVVLGAPL